MMVIVQTKELQPIYQLPRVQPPINDALGQYFIDRRHHRGGGSWGGDN